MLSIPDMALLGAAALMFFGPEQLPKVARKVGLLVRDVQNTSQSFIREMERAADDTSYTPDISRAHLIEDPLATGTPPAPYEPPAHDPYLGEPYTHPYASEPYTPDPQTVTALEHSPASPHHDVMPPRAANGASPDHDLPP
jgi:sec-independent protein translocase protein TatA